ncbi:cysteine desulfurase [Hoyosella sp. YIM 151337]|uniref:cysteine desulfurase family protein n=1 Tax=Hoyosella sp. YIM 151337 TaxID=2992742 RepID=UPI002235FF2F|nr:cysteine desulfurase family protein [Hoyosella sp. YIM 151337]MCW4354587.1 cysteine desulfurase [Hoyosella sp. YIM 151337]
MTSRPHPVYLDHAAATPLLPTALEAMTAAYGHTGNAASLHGSGRAARRLVEESRESIAESLGARPSEVIFTSGGTESDNLAVKGIFWARRAADPRRTRVIVSSVEHHAVLDAVEWLAREQGAQITWLPVTRDGAVDPGDLREALAESPLDVALVTVMWANNEVGAVNPIAELAQICRAAGVPMHSDGVQAAGPLAVDFGTSGLSALSIAAHKLGGPHGIGALLLGRDVACSPLLHGGGHERDVRSGTPDAPAAAGLAAALRAVGRERGEMVAHLERLRDRLVAGILGLAPDAQVNGPVAGARLPGLLNVTFPGCEGDSLLMLLDAQGIECSTGSACTAGVARASHVLVAMGMDPAIARGSLRFSFGHTSSDADVDRVLEALPSVIDRARAAGLASAGVSERG